jgi:hypothetical protein
VNLFLVISKQAIRNLDASKRKVIKDLNVSAAFISNQLLDWKTQITFFVFDFLHL